MRKSVAAPRREPEQSTGQAPQNGNGNGTAHALSAHAPSAHGPSAHAPSLQGEGQRPAPTFIAIPSSAPAAEPAAGAIPLFDKCRTYDYPDRIKAAGMYPYFRVIESAQDPEVIIAGQRLVMLGSNNCLGLTNHPKVKEAAIDAVRRYGTGCGGSRFLNGTL